MKIRHAAILLTLMAVQATARAQEVRVLVQADQVLHPLSPYLTGACLEDVNREVYGALYSRMIFGESSQEPPAASPFTRYRAA